MKKIPAFLLAAAMMLTLSVIAAAAEENRQYTFELTANGASAVTAEAGDVIDVVCTLKRTDGADEDRMYALQNNITWDNTFFNMVPGSLNMKNDVDGREKAMMGNINFVAAGRYSMNGDKWSCENVICSFRLRVIATTGVGRIESRDACVVGQDSSRYPVTVNSVTVTVSNRCEITYNPNNGESSSAVTAEAGDSITLPAAPQKEGYRFKCWRWDNKDYAEKSGYTVSTNANFVAIWEKPAEYTLTTKYVYADGTTAAADTTSRVAYGADIADATLAHHTFIGWQGTVSTMPAADTTVTAVVVFSDYTVAAVPYVSYVSSLNKTMYRITVTLGKDAALKNGTAFFYGDEKDAMFVNADGTYSWLIVVGNDEYPSTEALEQDVVSKLSVKGGTAQTYNNPTVDTGRYNVNMFTKVDVSDAVLAYDISRGVYEDFSTVIMAKFLNANLPDPNDNQVTVLDAQAVVSYILSTRIGN